MALPHRCGGNFIQRRLTDLSGWLWSDIDGTRWEILRWLHKKAVGMKPVGELILSHGADNPRR